jgi:hypothetical protein
LTLVPVATNVHSLYADWETWSRVGQTSALAPVAHAMPGRIHALTIAASDGAYRSKSGSEPHLDPLFSSYALDVRSVHGTVLRIEKVRTLARHPEALAVLRVCLMFDIPAGGTINCGRCEKCLRTLLALVAADALERAPTFPVHEMVPGMLERLEIQKPWNAELYRALSDALRARGRRDLAEAIAARVADYVSRQSRGPKSLRQRLFGG